MDLHPLSAQSAMEYLITYGWAVLLVAIVLWAMYELGVFGFPSPPMVCLANPLFYCANETMSSSGALTVTFGYTGGTGPITLTALVCNTTAPAPVKGPSVETTKTVVYPGQQLQLVFQCPVSGEQPLGAAIGVGLWIFYNTSQASGLVQEYAKGIIKVDYRSLLWNVTTWTPSSSNVQLLPYSSVSSNPPSPSGITTENSIKWSSLLGNAGEGWAYGTDYHNHDIYFGIETTLFPISPLYLDNAPCSGPPFDSHGYTATTYANMSGTYNFTVVSDDATEIFYRPIGGGAWTSVYNGDAWKGQPPHTYTQYETVAKGNYEIVVDYMDICDPAGVSVLMISPAPSPLPV